MSTEERNHSRETLRKQLYDKHRDATLLGLGVMHRDDVLDVMFATLERRPELIVRLAYVLSGLDDPEEFTDR